MSRCFKYTHVACILMAFLLAGAGCRQAGETPALESALPGKGFNVAVILVDTLRPDHLGCYGYERPTSPNLDALAAKGVVFDAAHTASTYTGEAVAALFTGRPPAMGPDGLGWSARPTPMASNLPGLFEAVGYKTGIFSTSFVMRFRGFYDSFQESELFPGVPNTSSLEQNLTDAALNFAKRHKEEPMFQYLHYYAPHAPYNPPEEFLNGLGTDRSILDPEAELHPAALVSQGMKEADPRWEELKKHYDGEIRVVDKEIARFLNGLLELGLDRKTVVVVLSDHGEEFMEHGFADHAWNLYEETLRIPLIVWAPALFTPQRITEPVSIIDVMPTLLQCLQIPHEPFSSEIGGQYLFTPGKENWEYRPRTGPIYASLFPETRAQLHAVLFDGFKYISGPRWLAGEAYRQYWFLQGRLAEEARTADFQPLDPWAAPKQTALFDLQRDSGETRDIAAENGPALSRGKAFLDAYKLASEAARAGGPPVSATDPYDVATIQRMMKALAEQAATPGTEGAEGERLSPDVIEGLETMGYL